MTSSEKLHAMWGAGLVGLAWFLFGQERGEQAPVIFDLSETAVDENLGEPVYSPIIGPDVGPQEPFVDGA